MNKSLTAALRGIAAVDNDAPLQNLDGKLHVSFLLDRSGSMSALREETIQAFNDYLDTLRSNPGIVCSLHQFDTDYGSTFTTTYERQPVATVPPLSYSNFHPRGGTPLYWAIAKRLTDLYQSEPLGRHVVVILTDGEDSSGGNSLHLAKKLIAKRRSEGWQILFLGAGLDVTDMARKLGIDSAQSLSYDARDYSSETFKALAGSINDYANEEAHEEIDLSSFKRIGRS